MPTQIHSSDVCYSRDEFNRSISIAADAHAPVVIPDDLKRDIARVVRTFEFINSLPGGNCIPRAVVGHAVLSECGIVSRVVCGALLYRVGKHRTRDTLRLCLPDNTGGYCDGYMRGHAWNEVGDEIADFSSGDWFDEVRSMYETSDDVADIKLGPVEWNVTPPEFIWQSAHTLRSAWRPRGQPTVGGLWYGPWSSRLTPNTDNYDEVVDAASPMIRFLIADAKLRERVAGLAMD